MDKNGAYPSIVYKKKQRQQLKNNITVDKLNFYILYSKGANMKANFFTKFLANIFDFAVILKAYVKRK